MNIIYKRILNLIINHDYFKDGFDKFITFYPTTETKELLTNGKMLFKKLPNGLTLLYRALDDEITPFIDLGKDQHFTFALKSENISGLLNITNLDESPSRKFGNGNILYFTNNPALASVNTNIPEILSLKIIDTLRSSLFTYQFKIDGNPATVKMIVTNAGNPVSVGKDGNGDALPDKLTLSISANNTFEQQIDLRNYQKGLYKITILNAAETLTSKEEQIYVDEQLEKENILGIVDIVYETATNNLYGETEEYKLQFRKANTFWKYYVVNKSPNINLSTDSLLIIDSATPNGFPYVTNDFERVYAGIKITAKTTGILGNSTALEYLNGGIFPAIRFSGKTLSGGDTGVKASGSITIINNDVFGYTTSIGEFDFIEGSDFSRGLTPAETASNLIAAINGNSSIPVTAESLPYDILLNDAQTLVFSSKQEIPFYQIPKLKIELRQTSTNQIIIANLPNPSHKGIQKVFANRLESEVYVFI